MNDKVNYWVDLSNYDIETADAMLKSFRYLYVGFMCHQAIEKILKAYFISTQEGSAPFTHSLSHIAKKSGIYESFDSSVKDFIDMLEPLNIETRYPSHKEKLLKSLTEAKCQELIEKTKSLQTWIKAKL
jgi:HEPN domain-containing protein